jgi:hypothetical protein
MHTNAVTRPPTGHLGGAALDAMDSHSVSRLFAKSSRLFCKKFNSTVVLLRRK